jgi:nucleoside-diphosphate-sugar epimerase
MKILITGATGYIGGAVAEALLARGHHVLALARSPRSADRLRGRGLEPVGGDFSDPASLHAAITHSRPDAVVSTASLGASRGDTAATFARDRDAVRAMQQALAVSGAALIFTSGSAVFGTFNSGHATQAVFDEDSHLPLPTTTFAPPDAGVPAMLVAGFGQAMAARVETEQTVLADTHVRGIVVRPGLVYGRGGSLDIPTLIARARARGRAGHWVPAQPPKVSSTSRTSPSSTAWPWNTHPREQSCTRRSTTSPNENSREQSAGCWAPGTTPSP